MKIWCSISVEMDHNGVVVQRFWIGNNSLAAIDPVLLKWFTPIIVPDEQIYSERISDYRKIHSADLWMEV